MSHRNQAYPPRINLNEREQIQYLLGNPPSWMMRYGITVIISLFSILIFLSYLIHYPDTVSGKVELTTEHPPIRLMANSSGKVAEILVNDKEPVKKGQVVAIMENPANWRDVIRLEQWLQAPGQNLPQGLVLGSLQSEFAQLGLHWKDKTYFDLHNGIEDKIAHLQQQVAGIKQIISVQQKQVASFQEDFELANKAFLRQQQLHAEKVVSDKDFEAAQTELLGHKRQLENANTALLQSELQIVQLNMQIRDLRQGKSDNNNTKSLTVTSDLQQLESALALWKQTFMVIAPIGGYVSFSRIWSPQQSVRSGEEVMAIVPDDQEESKSLLGKVQLPVNNAGKIEVGQKAILKFDAYPEQEYGVVEALVANISLLPQKDQNESLYLIDLHLPTQLKSSMRKEIPFRQEMSGEVRIITEDRRVLDRIFGRLRDLLSHI